MAACLAASALLVLLAPLAWLLPRPKPDGQPENAIARQEPSPPQRLSESDGQPEKAIAQKEASPPQPMSEEEAEAYISRQTRVARLAVAVELLASQPGLETYKVEAEKYLAQVSRTAGP